MPRHWSRPWWLLVLPLLLWPGLLAAECRAVDDAGVAATIAGGHAFHKHVEGERQFVAGARVAGLPYGGPEIAAPAAFQKLLLSILIRPSAEKALANRRHAYWDGATGTVVIVNRNAGDCGTAFRPDAGKVYFDRLR